MDYCEGVQYCEIVPLFLKLLHVDPYIILIYKKKISEGTFLNFLKTFAFRTLYYLNL